MKHEHSKTSRAFVLLAVALFVVTVLAVPASAGPGTAFRGLGECRGEHYASGDGSLERCRGVYMDGNYVCVGEYTEQTYQGQTTKNCEGGQTGPPPSASATTSGEAAFRGLGKCRGDHYSSDTYRRCNGLYTDGNYLCLGTFVESKKESGWDGHCEGVQSGGPPPSG